MRKWIGPAVLLLFLVACQPQVREHVTLRADGKTYFLSTSERVPSRILAQLGLSLGPDDRLLYLGASTPAEAALPDSPVLFLDLRRAGTLTLVGPDGTRTLTTSAATVGQALAEAGMALYAADRFDPPAETPLLLPMTVTYTPARPLTVHTANGTLAIRSAAGTVGQALAEAGLSLQGLDTSQPDASAALPADGQVRLVHVVESVALTEKSLPYSTRTELTADLELDQQSLLQPGAAGLAVTRTRTRSEDGVTVATTPEGETVVRPPEDRVVGYGTKVVLRTATVDGQTLTYWRVLNLYATAYSPCASAGTAGKCYTGTSSGRVAGKGVVAMVYSWYLLFGNDTLYIPGYGYGVVGDTGGGAPPGNHYWIDLGYADGDPAIYSWGSWVTVYFLAPPEPNPGYILP